MQTIEFHIRGTAPLITHNARLSDPLDEWAKQVAEISKKKTKTELDHQEMSKREWRGGLYTLSETDDTLVIPESNLERLMRDAATKSKRGKDVLSGLLVFEPAKIIYTGPKDLDKMWASGNFALRASCKVGQRRVMRTRPCFDKWELKFRVDYDPDILKSSAEVVGFVELAGRYVGIGDWRPKHGRFEVVESKEVA